MIAAPVRRTDRILAGLLLTAVCCWMIRAHWERIDLPDQAAKIRLHEQVLANEAPDPYQYKLWPITHAMQWAHETSGQGLGNVFYANTLLSLVLLVLAHHRWLRTWTGTGPALVGGLALGALANVLFLTYVHHPYEFWGIAGFCLLLRAVERDAPWWALTLLCLGMGVVWEKHALVPGLWGLLQLARGRAFLPSLWRGLVMLAAALAVPLLIRWHLGTERAHVDGMTYLHVQEWDKVLWFQLPYLLPFLAILLLRFRALPGWVRLLWLYGPVLVAAYISQHFVLHEVRSFWPLVPVFTATLACWLSSAKLEDSPTDAPTPAPPPR
ncbi:MAG: hypothetical protein QNJ90_10850 [Planctomycetota bacterium]|nr:hypothetical protein [Planctomycetota bacterium]